jgi:hypothetical protein
MEELKKRLEREDVRGVVRTANGEIREFHRQGVIDLFTLLTEEPQMLLGAQIADRVIGRGAALLMVKGRVQEVFAYVISKQALDILQQAGIPTTYATLQPHIINRAGTDICPVEKLTASTDDPDEAYELIKEFLK